MGIINKSVFNKSYMLEILKNGNTQEVFTFSMPPKSEELDFAQRVTETKTFGGSVIDRYGNDTARIVLSGSTGNEDNKIIYRGLKKVPKYLNGENEIFWLQKILNEYHQQDKLTDGITIYLYDLSKMNVVEFATLRPSKNWWRVFIKDFKIKRDDSKPKTFNYTLDMIAISDENKKEITGLFKSATTFVDGFTKAMEIAQSVMEYTEGAFALIEEATNTVAKWQKAYDEFSNMSGKGQILTTLKNADSFSRILTGNANNTLYNSAKNVYSVANKITKWAGGETIETQKTKSKILNSASFTIIFDSNGGNPVPSQSVEYSRKLEKPEAPKRDEYSFECWCSDKELENEYDFSQEVTEAFTLYARWKLSVATVTFNTNFGSATRPAKVNVGEKIELPENPTKKGCLFKEWCVDSGGLTPFDPETPIFGNLTLYAIWTDACSVAFDSDGGTKIPEQNIKIGELVVYPMTPIKDNYKFAHWCIDEERTEIFDFSTPVTKSITLYAVFIKTTNTVTFDSNGGSAIENQKVNIGGFAEKPEFPEREGFDFVCWCVDKNCTNEFVFARMPVNSSIILYAKWRTKHLAVVFDSSGGSEIAPQSVAYKGKVVFPEIPTKENYVFEMWRIRSKEKTVPTGKFETVIVYENDGITPKFDGETGEKITEEKEILDYEYSEFDFETELTEDLTLYAKWFGGEV